MIKEFTYKDKKRKVFVTREDASYVEGIDFSYASDTDQENIQKFLEKYDVVKTPIKETTDEGDPVKESTEPEKKTISDEEKADWAPYMKFFRKYLKSNIQN